MSERPTTLLFLYRCAGVALWPGVQAFLRRRQRAGKEDTARRGERFGRPSRPRPPGSLVWLHAASVGEAVSALPLIDRLRQERPEAAVLVTTGTVTSAALMAERLPPGALHQYVPVDRAACVARFLDHWRPDLAIFVESEFWPMLMWEAHRRRIPMALVNGRVSAAAFANWRRVPRTIAGLLKVFSVCLARTAADAERLVALGALRVEMPGDLKYAAEPLPADAEELRRLQATFGRAPRWLAASTHPGEEEQIARAHDLLAATWRGLVTLIAPRHPARGAEIARALAASGRPVALRSAGAMLPPTGGVYIADTMGELGLFYRLAPVAFVGGSLVPHGGQNLLEPARLGAAILHGPHVENFRETAALLAAAGATETVTDGDQIAAAVDRLLRGDGQRERRMRAAAVVADAQNAVLDRVMAALSPLLDKTSPRAALSGADRYAPT